MVTSIFGVLTFIMPTVSLAVLVLLFGAYVFVEGVFGLIAAARGGPGPRWALVLEGLVSIAAGVVAFVMPAVTALALVYLIAAWALVTGVLEIVAAVRLRKRIEGEWRLALSGVLSLLFAVVLALAPVAGALAMTLLIGAYAVVFGVLLVALAFRLRRWGADAETPLRRAA